MTGRIRRDGNGAVAPRGGGGFAGLTRFLTGTALACVLGTSFIAVAHASSADLIADGGTPTMRRLTKEQYINSVREIFGNAIQVGGDFEPDPRLDFLLEVGSGNATVTPSEFDNYSDMASDIASQVLAPQNREQLVPCKPAAGNKPDDRCARAFLGKVGQLLFRGHLTSSELTGYVTIARRVTAKFHSFYGGLQMALMGMLESPKFLFVSESLEPDPSQRGAYRLTPLSVASRLSYLLWDTTPDWQLLKAAERGDLNSPEGLKAQVNRMLESPRFAVGVRAFFSDMLGFDAFRSLQKDTQLYPEWSRTIAKEAQQQTLDTIVHHLVTMNGDYRDLFTTRNTFMTPLLASVYRVPFHQVPGAYDKMVPYKMPKDRPNAGILTEISFLSLHSHPGMNSAVLRGRATRELLLCQRIPNPPANVSFKNFNAAGGNGKRLVTMRQRLDVHVGNPVCAGCHNLMDPIGLTFEHYNTIGGYRKTDHGLPIDTSGKIDGVTYKNATAFGVVMHNSHKIPACLVRRLYAYATAQQPSPLKKLWLKENLDKQFAAGGYRIRPLLRAMTLNPAFWRTGGTDESAVPDTSLTAHAKVP